MLAPPNPTVQFYEPEKDNLVSDGHRYGSSVCVGFAVPRRVQADRDGQSHKGAGGSESADETYAFKNP